MCLDDIAWLSRRMKPFDSGHKIVVESSQHGGCIETLDAESQSIVGAVGLNFHSKHN